MSQRSKVLREFTSHPGEILYREDIAATTGMSESQVTNAIWWLINNDHPVVKVTDGAWKYDPKSQSERSGRPLFEKVGQTKSGLVILEDEEGDVWFAYQPELPVPRSR